MLQCYRTPRRYCQMLMWGVIWTTLTLVCSGMEVIPDQITRIHYGMQFSTMEAVRFLQLNFNLNLVVTIPKIALPDTSRKGGCRGGSKKCQAIELCERLLGNRENITKPHRTQSTPHETIADPGSNLICGLMTYTLDRIEQTQTALSFLLATILKDSLDIFYLSTRWSGGYSKLEQRPNLANVPDALWDKLETINSTDTPLNDKQATRTTPQGEFEYYEEEGVPR